MDIRKLLLRKKKKHKDTATSAAMDPPGIVTESNKPSAVKGSSAMTRHQQPIELGTIEYCNLTADGKHGDFDLALQAASATGKPIFANFVEWPG